MLCNWFGHSKIDRIDLDEFFKIKYFGDEMDSKGQ